MSRRSNADAGQAIFATPQIKNMDAFDGLPPNVRRALAGSCADWSAAEVFLALKLKVPACRTPEVACESIMKKDLERNTKDTRAGLVGPMKEDGYAKFDLSPVAHQPAGRRIGSSAKRYRQYYLGGRGEPTAQHLRAAEHGQG